MNVCLKLLITCSLLISWGVLSAQDNKPEPAEEIFHEIRLENDDRVRGRIISSDKTFMLIVNEQGDTVTVNKSEIKNLKEISLKKQNKKVKNSINLPDEIRSSDYSRYFYTSPSYTIEKGKLTGMTQGFSYSNLTYGFTDKLSVEAGSSFTANLFGTPIIALTPKYRLVDKNTFKLSGHASIIAILPGAQEDSGLVTLFGFTTTRGDELKNVSFGVSGAMINGRLLPLPMFQLAGVSYINSRTAFVFDSQVISFNELLGIELGLVYNMMPGVRLLRKSYSLDLAIALVGAVLEDTHVFVPLPYVGYNLYLSKK